MIGELLGSWSKSDPNLVDSGISSKFERFCQVPARNLSGDSFSRRRPDGRECGSRPAGKLALGNLGHLRGVEFLWPGEVLDKFSANGLRRFFWQLLELIPELLANCPTATLRRAGSWTSAPKIDKTNSNNTLGAVFEQSSRAGCRIRPKVGPILGSFGNIWTKFAQILSRAATLANSGQN